MVKMMIAQALRRIKKLKGEIAEHTLRAQQGVSYEQGKRLAFPFKEQMDARKACQDEMLNLQARVAIANAKATVTDGAEVITHAEAIRRLQEMKGDIVFLKSLGIRNDVVKTREQEYDEATSKYVHRVTEVTWVSDLSEVDRDKQVRALQTHFEALNNAIEDHNHKVSV